MAPPRMVSVFGATGLQGTSIVNAILKDGTFTPRAITRNPDSEASLKLQARGVQVAKADLANKTSMVDALRGSEAVFGLTNYFEPSIFPGNPAGEIQQGKNLVDAAKEAGVKFFVFSSLPSMSKISGGKYTEACHFDNKETIEEYLRSSGMAKASIHLGGFFENYWIFHLLKKTDVGFNISIPKFSLHSPHNWTWVTPLGVEVTFTSSETSGMKELDEMFACQSEFASEFFQGVPVPNPDLVALGVKFSSVEEFMETEVKSRFGADQGEA
ncbi:NmrA-like family-domain-containing protein [Mycena epipterygia]|nr:NmrA-like family-domain-containing protein [Mycena epipterygia]